MVTATDVHSINAKIRARRAMYHNIMEKAGSPGIWDALMLGMSVNRRNIYSSELTINGMYIGQDVRGTDGRDAARRLGADCTESDCVLMVTRRRRVGTQKT